MKRNQKPKTESRWRSYQKKKYWYILLFRPSDKYWRLVKKKNYHITTLPFISFSGTFFLLDCFKFCPAFGVYPAFILVYLFLCLFFCEKKTWKGGLLYCCCCRRCPRCICNIFVLFRYNNYSTSIILDCSTDRNVGQKLKQGLKKNTWNIYIDIWFVYILAVRF